MEEAPRAFQELKGLVDFSAVMDTSGDQPRVLTPTKQLFESHWRMLMDRGGSRL